MNRFLILALFALCGCITLPEDARARARLSRSHDSVAQARKTVSIGTDTFVVSPYGYAFPDDALAVEIDRLVSSRQKRKSWESSDSVLTTKGTWRSEIRDDYLVLTHLSGEQPIFAKLYISAEGQIGVHASDTPKLDALEPRMRLVEASLKPKGSSAPIIIIP